MIYDLFAGAGGVDEGLRMIGRADTFGIEWDRAACATAVAAGHARLWADVAALDPKVVADAYGWPDGMWLSTPCQPFSPAGDRGGVDDPRGQLILEPARWARVLRPAWIVVENVPDALPHMMRHVAIPLRELGYGIRVGILSAADFGVPQTRERAFLIAALGEGRAPWPNPTHARHGPGLFHDHHPWVAVRDVLDPPGPYMVGAGLTGEGAPRPVHLPAPTVTTKGTAYWSTGRRLTVAELAALQGFRPDYPWHGTSPEQYRQVGDAVPPLLAAHVCAAALRLDTGLAA
jgi:DNA (cytosine-5)-methyltransferase 1